jgi:hypothetical protein
MLPPVEVNVVFKLEESVLRGVMLGGETTQIVLAVAGIILCGVPDVAVA